MLEGRPHTIDAIKNGEINLVMNTSGGLDRAESYSLRRTTLLQRVPYFTTVSGALAAALAIETARKADGKPAVKALQDYHQELERAQDPTAQPGPRATKGAHPTRVGYR